MPDVHGSRLDLESLIKIQNPIWNHPEINEIEFCNFFRIVIELRKICVNVSFSSYFLAVLGLCFARVFRGKTTTIRRTKIQPTG